MTVSATSPAGSRLTERLRAKGCATRDQGKTWTCPAHEDTSPSLSVAQGPHGVLLHCHAGCLPQAIVSAVGLTLADLFDAPRTGAQAADRIRYVYEDAAGQPVVRKTRVPLPGGKKEFFLEGAHGKDAWVTGLRARPDRGLPTAVKLADVPLYRTPQVREGICQGATVWISEGEKDVHALEAAGCVATCNVEGAADGPTPKWRSARGAELAGAPRVVVVADKDRPGYRHAIAVAQSLVGRVTDVSVVEARSGKDAHDHLAAGHGLDEFVPIDPAERLAALMAEDGSPNQAVEETSAPVHAGRVAVVVSDDLAQMVHEGIVAMTECPDVFERGKHLVHVATDHQHRDGVKRAPATPSSRVIAPGYLRELLSSRRRWAGADQYVLPPKAVVDSLSTRGFWPGVRKLVGIVETPVLRRDGSVLSTPGYDEMTGLLYLPSGPFHPIADRPTLADAKAAAILLLDLVDQFPYKDDEQRSAWLAGALTPFALFAYDGNTPLLLVDAAQRGTGKTKLVNVIAILATGRVAPVMSGDLDSTEWRKRITALAMASDSLVLIDNVFGKLQSAELDAVLTCERHWKDRVLGESRMSRAEIPFAAAWFATGNNVVLGGDLPRRAYLVRLESNVERPEERSDFTHRDLLAHVRQERGRYVAACLTILRAYCAAGRPDMGIVSWGSFEDWSALVRNAVAWLGMPDPYATVQGLREASAVDDAAHRELVEAWVEADPDAAGLTAQDLVALIARDEPARRAAPPAEGRLASAVAEMVGVALGKPADPRRIGNKLRALRGRVVGGLRLEKKNAAQNGSPWVTRRVS